MGRAVKRIDGFEGGTPARGEKNITFSCTVCGVGNHTFKLFLGNPDCLSMLLCEKYYNL